MKLCDLSSSKVMFFCQISVSKFVMVA